MKDFNKYCSMISIQRTLYLIFSLENLTPNNKSNVLLLLCSLVHGAFNDKPPTCGSPSLCQFLLYGIVDLVASMAMLAYVR